MGDEMDLQARRVEGSAQGSLEAACGAEGEDGDNDTQQRPHDEE